LPIDSVRYYLDPETGSPHIFNHGVSENEVEEILSNDLRGKALSAYRRHRRKR
jgi:hypothetical protein